MVDISNPDWSVTDGSNTQAPPNGWPVGMASNQVRPTAQAMMGGIKRLWERSGPALSTTGSAGAYVYTPTNTSYPTAYVQGDVYVAKANFTSIGSDTLNVNTLGALPLYKPSSSGPVAISAGDIVNGQIFEAAYDSALNSGLGGFQVTAGIPSSGSSPTLHMQVISSSGTFTIPSSATTATTFKFKAIGGGGGSGGSHASSATDGGGSGGARQAIFSGFTASANVSIAIGAGGTAGSGASVTNGGTGGTTTVTYNAVAIMTSTGGFGSAANGGDAATTTVSNAGTSSATAGASGLTLVSQTSLGASAGMQVGASGFHGGGGGSNAIGQGGNGGGVTGSSTLAPTAGVFGGGGGGAYRGASTATNVDGAAGGAGVVIVEWVL